MRLTCFVFAIVFLSMGCRFGSAGEATAVNQPQSAPIVLAHFRTDTIRLYLESDTLFAMRTHPSGAIQSNKVALPGAIAAVDTHRTILALDTLCNQVFAAPVDHLVLNDSSVLFALKVHDQMGLYLIRAIPGARQDNFIRLTRPVQVTNKYLPVAPRSGRVLTHNDQRYHTATDQHRYVFYAASLPDQGGPLHNLEADTLYAADVAVETFYPESDSSYRALLLLFCERLRFIGRGPSRPTRKTRPKVQ